MIVELHGARFRNKGAELMLRTVVTELGRRIDGIEFALGTVGGNDEQRRQLGLKRIFPVRPWMASGRFNAVLILQQIIAPLVPRGLAHQQNCVTLSEVDALVDIAGFAYTDLWGSLPVKNFAKLCDYYHRKGRPVIMLPQAIGPFNSPDSRSAFRSVLENTSLLYARDAVSASYVRDLKGNWPRLRSAPDITLFSRVTGTAEPLPQPYCCIILNTRMVDQGRDSWGQSYFDQIHVAIEESLSEGFVVYLVVHDSSDWDLTMRVKDSFKEQEDVVVCEEDDPVSLRQFIGKASYVVGSRYHGLIAAFSAAVPSLCMGWAHKYRCLYEDFGVCDFIIDPETPVDALKEKVSTLCDARQNGRIRSKLVSRLRRLSELSEGMWNSVVETLVVGQ